VTTNVGTVPKSRARGGKAKVPHILFLFWSLGARGGKGETVPLNAVKNGLQRGGSGKSCCGGSRADAGTILKKRRKDSNGKEKLFQLVFGS